jgi:hypothetical protein
LNGRVEPGIHRNTKKDTAAVEQLKRIATPTTIPIIFASSAEGYHTAGEPNKRLRSARRDHAAATGKTSHDAAATNGHRHGSSSQAHHSIISGRIEERSSERRSYHRREAD